MKSEVAAWRGTEGWVLLPPRRLNYPLREEGDRKVASPGNLKRGAGVGLGAHSAYEEGGGE